MEITTYRDPTEMPEALAVEKYQKLTKESISQRERKLLPKFLKGALKAIEKSAKNGKTCTNYYGNKFLFRRVYPDDDILVALKKSLLSMGFDVMERTEGPLRISYLNISWDGRKR